VEAPRESRFCLVLHYDGSHFFGWQQQREERTVQGELQATLQRLTGERRVVTGSGRTDRGVHATGQVAAVSLPSRWTPAELRRSLNATLPRDIWVESVRPAPEAFHPRHDAVARSYRYRVGTAPGSASPFVRPWCWPLGEELDRGLLDAGAALLAGDHSFRAFARSGQEERGDRCVVQAARWERWDTQGVTFLVTANRFLHHMVRYLVGTMVEIGRGRRPLEEMEELLEAPDTLLVTSPPAPPEGLFLTRVDYPPSALDPRRPAWKPQPLEIENR